MNIVSSLVGISIMGAAAPTMVQMTLAPLEAQKRAENFGIAESAAVTLAAANEGATAAPKSTDVCAVGGGTNGAYTVTCSHGQGKYVQTVTRSFRLATETSGSSTGGGRTFAYGSPGNLGAHQCPNIDPFGVEGWWADTYKSALGNCIPQVGWTKAQYLASSPDDWLWDINGMRGYGAHPDY